MLSPPLTFILVLVALALEKVHACSYPNPYTSLASQSELPLCRRTLPESELREQCKGLCEATYPHLVILYEVGAHLMGECINECVSGESERLHQLAAAAINAVVRSILFLASQRLTLTELKLQRDVKHGAKIEGKVIN
ncbi:hypothetical protein F5887DRAFT_265188 [Amanita rubescens]|nr:hypothetical protein F5887DRAFT_265188 [Amanita rubescens]